MLIRFAVANYRSIRQTQELTLAAAALKDNEAGLIPCPATATGAVVPAAVIYGANASGKSNVVRALHTMVELVLYSHSRGKPGGKLALPKFALDETAASDFTAFDIDFMVEGVRYQYGFRANEEAFTDEWLYAFPKGRLQRLYSRISTETIEFNKRKLTGRNRVISDLMRPNSLFLSAALQNSHKQLSKIASFFQNISFSDETELSIRGSALAWLSLNNRIIKFLEEIGTGIVGFRQVEREPSARDTEIQNFVQSFVKKLVSSENEAEMPKIDWPKTFIELAHRNSRGGDVFFDPSEESAGTRRMLLMLNSTFRALEQGSLLVIDELDASLHTQACEAIVALFSNKETNPQGAQLIVTTHDTNLMRSPSLRRDQIWFTEKDKSGATHLFPLSDIQTKRGDNIEKGYLQGRFGAIPFAGPVETLISRL